MSSVLGYTPGAPSTSRTSLDDLASDSKRTTGEGALIERGQGGRTTRAEWGKQATTTGKGKERCWEVELTVIGTDGVKRRVEEGEVAMGTEVGGEGERAPVEHDELATMKLDSERASQNDPPPDTPSPAPSPPSPLPPPSSLPSSKPERPPLQSILKRPPPARTPSSAPSNLSFSTSLLPLPSSPSFPPPPLSPGLASPASPDSLESHDKSHVLFSTPGTNSTVLPLSTSSVLGGSDGSQHARTGSSSLHDPLGTIKSWKSSIMGRKNGNIDKKRLASLGYDEELNRDYDFWASFGISMCNMGALPGTTLGVLTALRTGGGSMYAIAWPVSGLFMICVAAVLGEMASTWPVAGASFTWVFRLCRSKKSLDPWARFLSWVTGSLLLCSHLLLQIVVTWQFSHNLLGVITLFTGKHYSTWVTIGVGWGMCILSALITSSRLSRSPWLWRFCGGLIVAFFFVINITLLARAENVRSAKYVFTSYSNETGFESRSYVYMVGWVLTCVCSGFEASAHIAEDSIRPSRTVPLAMFWATVTSYLLGWFSICVVLATMQRDGVDPNLQPSIALLANSLPRSYTTLILVFVLLSFLFQCVAQLLATSRYIWALARESAVPFGTFFRRLSKNNRQPSRAIWGTIAIAFPALLFLVINTSIISTTLLEGAGITATSAYVAPLLIYLFCPNDVLAGDGRALWTLRGASKLAAVPACVFLLTFIIVLCLPTGYPITTFTVSYASVVFVGVLVLSSVAWVFYGNGNYAGPIKTTTRWTIGAEVDLPSSSSHGETQRRKKTTAGAHVTTSAAHGRSAHVFATSAMSGDEHGEEGRGTEMTGRRTTMSGTQGISTTGGGTETGTGTGTGSEWKEYTDESYTDDDEDEEDDDEETEEEEDERGGGGRSSRSQDEERSVGSRRPV